MMARASASSRGMADNPFDTEARPIREVSAA
jgi:hypothetical protein